MDANTNNLFDTNSQPQKKPKKTNKKTSKKTSKKHSFFKNVDKKKILDSILSIVIFTLLLGFVFFGIMQLIKYFFMGSVAQSTVPWLYAGAYILSLIIVSVPYFIFIKKRHS